MENVQVISLYNETFPYKCNKLSIEILTDYKNISGLFNGGSGAVNAERALNSTVR